MDDKDLAQPTSISRGPASPSPFKSKDATYKGEKVTIIRIANPTDGDDLDLSNPHFLVRNAEGTKKVVPVSEVNMGE